MNPIGRWLTDAADWTILGTHTWRPPSTWPDGSRRRGWPDGPLPDPALRHLREWADSCGVSDVVVSLETGPRGGRLHAHSLVSWDCTDEPDHRDQEDLFGFDPEAHRRDNWPRTLWEAWYGRFGRATFTRIYNSGRAAQAYAVKYLTKETVRRQLWDIRTNGRNWYG